MGTTFSQNLEASALSHEKQVVLTHCMDLLIELLAQYQMCLPASMDFLWKLELFILLLVCQTGHRELPKELFSGSPDSLATQLFAPQPMLTLWTMNLVFYLGAAH